MTNCQFCQNELDEYATVCPLCHAKKGFLKIDNFIIGKFLFILSGLIIPFIFILFGIAAQNLFGVYVSIFMTVVILITLVQLLLGARWFK